MTGVRQPSGTVTLVFTDIEGSTRLLEALGLDDYREALGVHRHAVRFAFARHEGYEVAYEGDSFFYAFPTAEGAVSAAHEAVVALDPGPIRIRVGIHTGRPGLDPPKYVGLDVHRAARIMGGAHGGQIVLSRQTADLLGGAFALTDLGEHRYKDIAEPERIYQLGEDSHPPLRSLYRITLPVPATSFLGREDDLETVVELLARPETRLLTLTGTGGTGKTRLALQAAAEASGRFPDGTTWIGLAPLREPELVIPMLAQTLGIREQPGESLRETVARSLLGKDALLILDNAEHLLPGVATDLAALLTACPTLRALVTSRERLRIQPETAWPVPTLTASDAERLFLDRARATGVELGPDPAITAVCLRLDHLPLAIELAAARVPLFSPAQLLDRLAKRLDLLRGNRDTDPRQQTLQGAMDWSYDLLDAEEQRVYRMLSVFAGGSTLEAAEAVSGAGPDALQSLLEKHLLRRRSDGPVARYSMLETIRHHAASRLMGEEARDAVHRALASLADTISSFENDAIYSGSEDWAPAFRAEEESILGLIGQGSRHALADEALELAVLSAELWFELGSLSAASVSLETLAADPGVRDAALRARALRALARLDDKRGAWGSAIERCSRALELFEQLDDREGQCVASGSLGAICWSGGDTVHAREHLERSLGLAEALGNDVEIARASYNLGLLVTEVNDSYAEALPLLERSHEALRRTGHTPGTIMCLQAIGEARCEALDHVGGLEALTESLRLAHETHHEVHIPGILESLAEAAVATGARSEAARFVAAADDLRVRHGSVTAEPNTEAQRELRSSLRDETAGDDPSLDVAECLALAVRLARALSDARLQPGADLSTPRATTASLQEGDG